MNIPVMHQLNSWKYPVFFTVIFTYYIQCSYAQDADLLAYKQTVGNFTTTINSLNREVNGNRKDEFTTDLQLNTYRLKVLIQSNSKLFTKLNKVDTSLLKSMDMNLHYLQANRKNNEVIFALLEDITLKANAASLAQEMNILAPLPVVVTTYDSTLKPVSGYYVYWNCWLDKNNLTPNGKFEDFTDPGCIGRLIPGTYDIWVSKPGSTVRFPPADARTKTQIFVADGDKPIELKIIIH